jgi:predicted permease
MTDQLLGILLPIVFSASIGFFWVKFKQPMDKPAMGKLVMNIGFPCLLLGSIDRPGLTLPLLGRTFLAGGLAVAAFALLGTLALRLLRLPPRRFIPAMVLPNTGNLGIPIAYFVYGPEGMVFALAFSTMVQVGHATLGIWLASGHMTLRKALSHPMLWTMALTLLLIGTGTPLPAPVLATVKLVGGISLPLMLIMLGASLTQLSLDSFGRALALSGVRVLGGLGVGLALGRLLHMPPVAAGTFAIQCAMPVAVVSLMLAEQFGGPSKEISGMVLVSTVLTALVLPLILLAIPA